MKGMRVDKIKSEVLESGAHNLINDRSEQTYGTDRKV